VPELSTLDILLRLGLAALLTGAIGAERELRERSAGLRTYILVGVGSALFTLVSAYAWSDFVQSGEVRIDPTRIAAQIVTGVGFLGAGAILRQGLSVRGLTTAAGLWAAAAIGMAAAAGFWVAAVATTAIVMVALAPLRTLERHFVRFGGDLGALEVRLTQNGTIGPVVDLLAPLGVTIQAIELEETGEGRWARIEVELPSKEKAADLLRQVAEVPAVEVAKWSG
jgi:putative Mg2+ transporter-C (MgtC) family protein